MENVNWKNWMIELNKELKYTEKNIWKPQRQESNGETEKRIKEGEKRIKFWIELHDEFIGKKKIKISNYLKIIKKELGGSCKIDVTNEEKMKIIESLLKFIK